MRARLIGLWVLAGCPAATIPPEDAHVSDAAVRDAQALADARVSDEDGASADEDARATDDARATEDARPATDAAGADDATGADDAGAAQPTSLLLSASQGLYVAARDPATGRVDPNVGNVAGPGGSGVRSVAVHPSGRRAYVTDGSGGAGLLFTYDVDVPRALLTPVDADPTTPDVDGVAVGTIVTHLAIDPSGRWLLAPARLGAPGVGVFRIDTSTIPAPGPSLTLAGGPVHVAFAAGGRRVFAPLYDAGAIAALDFDPSTGVLTAGPRTPLREAFAVAVHPRLDVLYAVSTTPPTLGTYAITPATGALTRTASVALGAAFALALSPDGSTLYASDEGAGGLITFAVDPVTGTLRRGATAPLTSGNGNFELTFDAAGRFLYVDLQGEVAVLERAASGALTLVQTVPFGNFTGQLAIAP